MAVSCTAARANRETGRVSLHELLSAPRQFDGDRVSVQGYFLFPMVGDKILYATEEDYRGKRRDRAIRVDVDPNKISLMPYQAKACVVTGIFRAGGGTQAPSLMEVAGFKLDE
jgi:hypothetical protein